MGIVVSLPRLGALTDTEIAAFIRDGFVRIDGAFPEKVAAEARDILWRDTGFRPDDPAGWTSPIVRLGFYGEKPFARAANMPILHEAFDQLVGKGRWLPRMNLGTFPIRFPVPNGDLVDTSWHIDVSFRDADDPEHDFLSWRANVTSRGRALLLLFLFSDVGPDDAATRIRVGSHNVVARQLAGGGERGLTLRELSADGFAATDGLPEVLATGIAGTVYLCHPFLVHAAQAHHGTRPRFMAQPPLLPAEPFALERADGDYSPVEIAIRQAVASAP